MWQLREGVHPVLTEEGGALLDERTGRWTFLTPTAAAALALLLASDSTEQAADRYADRYGIDGQQAAHDLRTVADTLTTSGLLLDHPEPASRR